MTPAVAVDTRVPPHDIEAEQALLGTVIGFGDDGAESIGLVSEIVTATEFYASKHRRIFEAAMAVYDRGALPTAVLVADELATRGSLEEIGGTPYLADLACGVAGPTNAEHYARIVHDKSLARNLIRVACEIQHSAQDENAKGEDLLEHAQRAIERAANPRESSSGHVVSMVDSILADLDSEADTARGVPTGLTSLDSVLGGMRPGQLVLVGGRPGMGKTALMLTMAIACSLKHDVPAGFFSLEMPRTELTRRAISLVSGVPLPPGTRGRFLSDADRGYLSEARVTLRVTPLVLDDTPALSISALRFKARRLMQKHRVGVLFVDYLGLMAMPEGRAVKSVNDQLGILTRGLKQLAKELSVPIVLGCQLNRAVEGRADKKPTLADLRESGHIEQDCDVVLLLYREAYYSKAKADMGRAQIDVAKHRGGPVAVVHVGFQEALMRFEDARVGDGRV